MGMFGGIALLPLYLQIVHGATPTQSGLLLLPLTAGIMVGSIISGQLISRTGRYKIYPIVGAAADGRRHGADALRSASTRRSGGPASSWPSSASGSAS